MRAILTYHSLDDSGSPISVAPAAFERHVAWMASGRVRVGSLSQLVTAPDTGEDTIAVTFDDGFLNSREAMLAMRAAGLPVTVFVVTDHAGGTNAWGGKAQEGIPTLPLLPWDDLARLVAAGVAVEAHTRTHPRLTGLSGGQLEAEIQGAADDLHRRLGVTSRHLAYPFGEVNEAVAGRAAGCFGWGYTTRFAALGPADRPMWCPRLDMYYFRGSDGLDRWGTPGFERRLQSVRIKRAVRRGLGRLLRT